MQSLLYRKAWKKTKINKKRQTLMRRKIWNWSAAREIDGQRRNLMWRKFQHVFFALNRKVWMYFDMNWFHLGKEMVDYIADYLENIRQRRVFPGKDGIHFSAFQRFWVILGHPSIAQVKVQFTKTVEKWLKSSLERSCHWK